jgi:hypothetical protein
MADCYVVDACAVEHLGCPILWDIQVWYWRGGDGRHRAVALPVIPESSKLGYSGPVAILAGGSHDISEGLYRGELTMGQLQEARITRAAALINRVDDCGITHIISSDGNMEDEHIRWIESEIVLRGGTRDEKELIELLKLMTLSEREEAYRLATGYDGE